MSGSSLDIVRSRRPASQHHRRLLPSPYTSRRILTASMSSYADATKHWLPSDQPKPDPAFLDGLQPANLRKTAPTIDHHDSLAQPTPPLTPPGELSADAQKGAADGPPAVRQRKTTSSRDHNNKGDKRVPGEGFAQSIKGQVSERRHVIEDLDQRIAQPCASPPSPRVPSPHPRPLTLD